MTSHRLNVFFDFLKKYWYHILIFAIIICAIVFRVEALRIRESWWDEAALAYNFVENEGILWTFKPLAHFQMAPPLFLILTKFVTSIFQGTEWSYRIIPFLSSIISIPVFYILSTKFLTQKRAVIFANFLYAVNFALIRWATEFKQYSGDILIFMLVFLWLNNFDKKELQGLKGGVKLTLIFTILFFISQPTIFLLFGFLAYHFLSNVNNYKTTYKILFKLCLIPILPLLSVFLYKNSMPGSTDVFMYAWWGDGFITIKYIPHIVKENLNFFFYNIKCLMFLAPLIFAGFFICLFSKDKIYRFLMLCIFGAIAAGVFRFYPYLHRLILFLFPFFIIFIAKVFDFKIQNKVFDKILSFCLIGFTCIFLVLYSGKIICKNRTSEFDNISKASTVSLILKDQFNNKTDILIYPRYNKIFYIFYKDCLKINIKKENTLELLFFDKDNLKNSLANIDKDKNYWIYIPSYYTKPSGAENLLDYVKNNGTILYQKKLGIASHLYKVKFF